MPLSHVPVRVWQHSAMKAAKELKNFVNRSSGT
jgi:hypothetical protein